MTSNTISISELKEKIRPIFESYPVNKAILFGRGTSDCVVIPVITLQ